MRIDLHPEALAEFRTDAIWFDEREAGLGDSFIADIKLTLQLVVMNPAMFPRWPGAPAGFRRAVTSKFPYVIAFEVGPERILVLAIAHGRRRPLYWLTRAEAQPRS